MFPLGGNFCSDRSLCMSSYVCLLGSKSIEFSEAYSQMSVWDCSLSLQFSRLEPVVVSSLEMSSYQTYQHCYFRVTQLTLYPQVSSTHTFTLAPIFFICKITCFFFSSFKGIFNSHRPSVARSWPCGGNDLPYI